tara:strand:+ start:872 stop:1096 length:225 start_codon:yes stop_codon:yes gene_type:complete
MVLDNEVKEAGMSYDLEEIMKSKGGISLWNMDMKNSIWKSEKLEKEYLNYWNNFCEGYDRLLNFVKDAEKNEYF